MTSHDGFTLADLVAYHDKHNDANGEDNRDGDPHNLSLELRRRRAVTDDPVILELRRRQRRNFALTLIVSQGVPMLSGGDEVGRTQLGNNNAYCQDSPLSWIPWDREEAERPFQAFIARLNALRATQPVLRRRTFLSGRRPGNTDVLWIRPDGQDMTNGDWTHDAGRALGMLLDGRGILERDRRGEEIIGDSLLILFNSADREQAVHAARVAQRIRMDPAHRYRRSGGRRDHRGRRRRLDAAAALGVRLEG